jgi:hypothetical protein
MPQFSALFVMLILFSLNLMTIPTAIEVFTGGRLIHDELIPGGVFFAISVISYFLLVHNGRYKKIAKEFSGDSPAQRRTRLLGIWIYIIGSFIVFFGLLSIRDSHHPPPVRLP